MRRVLAIAVIIAGFALIANPLHVEAVESVWTAVGAPGTNVREVVIDPTDSRYAYGAARNDGVWRSTDGGTTWVRSNSGLDFAAPWGVAVDPTDPAIVWAATEVGGAYRSTDRAATWHHTHDGMTDAPSDYTFDAPSEDSSSAQSPLWVNNAPDKVNRGGMWGYPLDQCLSDGPACSDRYDWAIGGFDYRDPDIDPSSSITTPASAPYGKYIIHFQFASDVEAVPGGVWMSAFRGSSNRQFGGLFSTTDGGGTWDIKLRSADGARIGAGTGLNLWRVKVAHSNPTRVYAGGGDGVWRSIDGGKTWAGDAPVRVAPGVNAAAFQGLAEVRGLAVDPTNADVVYAGSWGSGVRKSVDGGATYSDFSSGLPAGAGVWDVAVNPRNTKQIMAAIYYFGVYVSNDAGATWTPLNTGFNDDTRQQVYSVAYSGDSPGYVLAGTIDGVHRISTAVLGGVLAATGPHRDTSLIGWFLVLAGLGLLRRLRRVETDHHEV